MLYIREHSVSKFFIYNIFHSKFYKKKHWFNTFGVLTNNYNLNFLKITSLNISNAIASFFNNHGRFWTYQMIFSRFLKITPLLNISNDVASLFRNHAAAKHIVSLFTNNAAAKHQMMLPPSLKRYIPILLCSLWLGVCVHWIARIP